MKGNKTNNTSKGGNHSLSLKHELQGVIDPASCKPQLQSNRKLLLTQYLKNQKNNKTHETRSNSDEMKHHSRIMKRNVLFLLLFFISQQLFANPLDGVLVHCKFRTPGEPHIRNVFLLRPGGEAILSLERGKIKKTRILTQEEILQFVVVLSGAGMTSIPYDEPSLTSPYPNNQEYFRAKIGCQEFNYINLKNGSHDVQFRCIVSKMMELFPVQNGNSSKTSKDEK